jgi:hypothetical protein
MFKLVHDQVFDQINSKNTQKLGTETPCHHEPIPKRFTPKDQGMVTKLKDKGSKEGFLQNVELEGFRDRAREFVGDHPRQVPTSPSDNSLQEKLTQIGSNTRVTKSSTRTNLREEEEGREGED